MLTVHGLLVLDDANLFYPNIGKRSDPINTYIRCAAVLAKSAIVAGYSVVITTNRQKAVLQEFEKLGVPSAVKIQEKEFVSNLPPNAQHRSAHHKIELIKELGRISDGLSAIVDLDAVFLRPFKPNFSPPEDGLAVYDITSDMDCESGGQFSQDIIKVIRRYIQKPKWFGGEVLIGNKNAFNNLTQYIDQIESNYWTERSRLYHSGDETIVSSAINLQVIDGKCAVDLGRLGEVQRWWTSRRPYMQPSLDQASSCALLHLPADKSFISSIAHLSFQTDDFLLRYRNYARRKLLIRTFSNTIRRLVSGKTQMTVARLK